MITTTLPDICANAKESSGYIQTGEEFLREIEADFANSSRNQPVKPANITQIPTFHFECYEDDIPHQSVSFNSIDQNLLTAEMRDVSNLLYSPLPHQSSTFNHPTLIRLGESHPFPFTPYIPWSPTMYTPPVFSTSAEFLLHPSPIFNLETAANQIFPSLLAVDPGLDSLLSDFHFSDELDLFLVGTSNNDAVVKHKFNHHELWSYFRPSIHERFDK
ncbi:hypothetical protein BDR26DRAFT_896146 [Obelidium mucronatum]|nr:hypothetical protein BDR26DRAFT_896146 [Obelidium mucronatum]